jgi:hypothetical protein
MCAVIRRPGRTVRFLALFALVLCSTARTSRADLIILKDGFILQGQVRRESVTEFDPVGKEMFVTPRGFFLIDDGPRQMFFAPSQVRIVEKVPPPADEHVIYKSSKLLLNPRVLPPLLEVVETTEWDSKWDRSFYFRGPTNPRIGVAQHLGLMTPYFVRIDATSKFFWSSAHLTREFPPETVYRMLKVHPDFLDKAKDKPETIIARRNRLIDFLVQAGWFDLADKELTRLAKDYPTQKIRVASARVTLERMRLRERFETIKRLHHAGRHEAVRRQLADFSTKDAPDTVRSAYRELSSLYASTAARLAQAGKDLDTCVRELKGARYKVLGEAAEEIRKELHFATVDRLDAFLGQVRETQRQRARGRKPVLGPAELLSLAVSGWLLGSPSAESRPDAAISLWRTRKMVRAYLKEADSAERKRMLDDHAKALPTRVELDEVAQMIPNLPPAEPARDLSTKPSVHRVRRGRHTVTYRLQLPPEYTHHRRYPVLIVLPREKETPAEMMQRWAVGAAENGYILVSPEWEQGVKNTYGYSPEEHDTVLDTLADLRRRFQVDSDRVFLFGLSESAKMAFDVGMAHPCLFAGVIPMGAGTSYFPGRLWRNAQYLPFYVVNGNKVGPPYTQLRELFTQWVQRGYPGIWVSYKGRGIEWFSGEVPNLFDWMRRQKRAFPLRQLGTDGLGGSFGNEFCILRPEDNRFYWVTTSDVDPRSCTTVERWRNSIDPATVTARIDASTNEIFLKTRGLRQITIWLGRNSAGSHPIDFDKPVTVRLGFKAVWVNRKVAPSLSVLLEDLYKRGDRQHLFLAKIDLSIR